MRSLLARFCPRFIPFLTLLFLPLAWAGPADIKTVVRTDDGGRLVTYGDGKTFCFDKNERPLRPSACKTSVLSTEEGGRMEFYLNGDIICFDRNDRPAPGSGCKESAGENALLLKAGQFERTGNESIAKRYYETIIRLYPTGQAALRANDRLIQLSDSDKSADRQRRNVEEIRAIAEQNRRAEDERMAQALRDAERMQEQVQEQAYRRHVGNCQAGYSQCLAGCAGLRDKAVETMEIPPKDRCEKECRNASRACN